ncbi:SH3 domain-containing protein [Bacillus sp. 165]|uniref:SH3 domain-containing protein n=1 Tax=Bacillus sp. 165 TaxID=1529117 RepID=UPI001ADBCB06|nr:SH3 domain-containing protein [Bacillus sp. 165]MBO9128381.1 SH3 domain-containing protein [Bacillus sp. 165]
MRKFIIAFALLFAFLIPQEFAKAASSPSQLIIINTATNKLAFFENGQLMKEFPVASGKSSTPTPQGKFSIVNKIKNRPYYKKNIKGGDPQNPLGDRWMGMDIYGTPGNTYAIHGNNNESSIGKWISGGCVRMHNNDVHWLFDQINVRATVIIKNSNSSYESIAKSYGITLGSSTPVATKGTGKTTINLNVRTAPSTSASRITTLKAGTTVSILETGNGWYHITAGNITGWVSAQYISVSNSQPETKPEPAKNTGKTTVNLNVRTAPSTSANRTTTLKAGTTVTIHEEKDSWYRITAGTTSGWVSAQYIKK